MRKNTKILPHFFLRLPAFSLVWTGYKVTKLCCCKILKLVVTFFFLGGGGGGGGGAGREAIVKCCLQEALCKLRVLFSYTFNIMYTIPFSRNVLEFPCYSTHNYVALIKILLKSEILNIVAILCI